MPDPTDVLRRSLIDRLDALTQRVSDARASASPGHQAYRQALELVAGYPAAVRMLLEDEMEAGGPASLAPFILQLLRHSFDVTNFADQWLFGAAQLHDEQSLLAAVRREAAALGLGDRHALVVPGVADNFVTLISDPAEVVYGPLVDAGWDGAMGPDAKFVLLRVPEFEGRGGPWRPVVLGHELAHLAIEEHDALGALELADRLNLDAFPVDEDKPREPQLLKYLQVAEAWATELLCDAHAIRRFGPAGFAAMAEFLTAIGAMNKITGSHPPASLRLTLMLNWLGEVHPRYADLPEPWRQLVAGGAFPVTPEWVSTLIERLTTIADDLHETADWCEPYRQAEREPVVSFLVDRLLAGIPGAEVVELEGGSEAATDADVVNAGWLARTDPGVSVPVDRLVAKGLDTLVLVDRWLASGGALEVLPDVDAAGQREAVDPDRDGLLSGDELRARMCRDDEQQLVVTPLLGGAVGAAGLDIRLGNRFIVFQRTSIAQFDPLSELDDPRAVQRRVVRPWGDPFILHPGELVLAATIEYFRLPDDLTAQVITRSSYGRLGLITATAVQVNPGFRGCLTLELVNLGEVPLNLTPGERIAQLTFTPTRAVAHPMPAKYDCPTGPQFSAVHRDPDLPVLRALRGR